MSRASKREIVYRSCTGPAPVSLEIQRAGGSAQVAWLNIAGADVLERVFLTPATCRALWNQLGPICRDAQIEQAILDAQVQAEREMGIL